MNQEQQLTDIGQSILSDLNEIVDASSHFGWKSIAVALEEVTLPLVTDPSSFYQLASNLYHIEGLKPTPDNQPKEPTLKPPGRSEENQEVGSHTLSRQVSDNELHRATGRSQERSTIDALSIPPSAQSTEEIKGSVHPADQPPETSGIAKVAGTTNELEAATNEVPVQPPEETIKSVHDRNKTGKASEKENFTPLEKTQNSGFVAMAHSLTSAFGNVTTSTQESHQTQSTETETSVSRHGNIEQTSNGVPTSNDDPKQTQTLSLSEEKTKKTLRDITSRRKVVPAIKDKTADNFPLSGSLETDSVSRQYLSDFPKKSTQIDWEHGANERSEPFDHSDEHYRNKTSSPNFKSLTKKTDESAQEARLSPHLQDQLAHFIQGRTTKELKEWSQLFEQWASLPDVPMESLSKTDQPTDHRPTRYDDHRRADTNARIDAFRQGISAHLSAKKTDDTIPEEEETIWDTSGEPAIQANAPHVSYAKRSEAHRAENALKRSFIRYYGH